MADAQSTSDTRPASLWITLRGALAINAVLSLFVSIPLLGFGLSVTAGILLVLFVLQLPLLLLFGAFGMRRSSLAADNPQLPDYQEWDRWREERAQRQ